MAPDLTPRPQAPQATDVSSACPEVLRSAKTQRWAPEEVLRTLIEAEIGARDESNIALIGAACTGKSHLLQFR